MRLVVGFVLLCLASGLLGQAGNLDNSFSGDGKVIIAVGSGNDEAYDVTVQPDGKILVAGFATIGGQRDITVLRLNPDGSPDNTFSVAGKLTLDIDGENDEARQIALLPNGDILVAGTATEGASRQFVIVKLNSEGELQSSFGDGGVRLIDVGAGDDILYAMSISNNIIYLAGSSGPSMMEMVAVAAIDLNGNEINAFSQDGVLTFDAGTGPDIATAMVVQPDGKILLTGQTLPDFAKDIFVARISSAGEPDPGFDEDGILIASIGTSNDRAHAIAVQPDGNIIVGGYTYASPNDDFLLLRLLPDGSYDNEFDEDGIVIQEIGEFYDQAFAMELQPDGSIILAGSAAQAATDADFGVARFTSDGMIDNTFSGDGRVITPIGSGESEDEIFAVALQPDGKLVVAGTAKATNLDFAVARYHTGLATSIPSHPFIQEFYLGPNPVSSSAILFITIPENAHLSSQILTANGQIAGRIRDYGFLTAGKHQLSISIPDHLPGGYYFVHLIHVNGARILLPFIKE